MKKNLITFGSVVALLGALLFSIVPTDPAIAKEQNPTLAADSPLVALVTNRGTITLKLDAVRAPNSVKNFLDYVNKGHYNNTLFHRVIAGFMVQGGGFSPDFEKRATAAAINNEADNGLKNLPGSIAMARTGAPHSATAQFFINTANNRFLNHTNKSQRGWGYTVFGKVVDGIEVVAQIEQTPTGASGPFHKDAPLKAVIIESATVISQ
ncbi:MAG: peptidyl-prolyl cis-trans isomerase [Gammaproteobacteria bacterium]|jgi:peptidyl-prolyl cis-trans isomerase B (cyclophilin B)|nr:peptidyl-prolyl cis-trans isomerase [Gammaproteobacteria bacterium]MBT7306621.1 peptidyl-prolyl cis-trans isomerase [Gammaproteobacteria bacterium]